MSHVKLHRRLRARRALAFAGLASLAGGLLLLPAASPSAAQVTKASVSRASGSAPHASTGSSVTVTGKNLWDPAANKPLSQPSMVTVSQTTGLTDQLVQVSWKNFTPSINNQAGPYYTKAGAWYAVEAVECQGTNPASYTNCYQADEAGQQFPSGPSGPPNNTYAITTSAGTGQLNLLVETSLVNSALGCDQTHPCSLVIIPGQGGVPANGTTPANCADHSGDVGGFGGGGNALAEQTFAFTSTAGANGPCSWNDRIVVPLQFAPVPSGCPQRAAAFQAAGSPMMAPAMAQWLTGLCAGSGGMTIAYNSTVTEPSAVGQAVSGLADVALTTRPASADGVVTTTPFVYAPIAVSAVSINYWIDDNLLTGPQSGQPLTGLKLNQRLLAKLLTTSYNPGISCPPGQTTGCDPGVNGNPFDVVTDQEFKTLNPSISQNTGPLFAGLNYIAPTVQSGPSDMTWTVTQWIGADATAAAFLNGTADPFATHVNTYYTGLKYPTDTFTTQDPSTVWSQEYSPVFPLSQAVTYQALNESSGSIQPVPPPNTGFSKDPPEPVGDRALFAILDQGDAALDQFPTAAIPNASGNYVQPTAASMAAAVSHMVSNGSGTLQVNLADKTPTAYPLTMVIYAMVPTSGLAPAKAAAIASFLNFAAGAGQTPGTAPGQLAAGYLPLPANLAAQTRTLAVQVAKQTGNTGGGAPGNGKGTGSGAGPVPGPGTGAGTPSPSPSPASTRSTTPSGTRPPTSHQPISLIASHAGPASMTRFALPALLILGALLALGGSSALAGSAEGGIPGRLRWLGQATAAQSRRARALTRWRKL